MKKILLLSVCLFSFALVKADGRYIRFEQLPTEAQTFLRQYFPAIPVTSIKMDNGRMKDYEVLLGDGTKVEFDHQRQWMEVNMRNKYVPNEIVPSGIKSYVSETYPTHQILKIERKGNRHWVELSNGLELKFNARGRLVKIED